MRRLLLALLLGTGCGLDGTAAPEAAGADAPVALDGKADGATELRIRGDGLTLWLRPTLRVAPGRYVIAGRTSKNLAAASPWVPDDRFGEPRLVSARKFEIALSDH